jgi:hypothetical protein
VQINNNTGEANGRGAGTLFIAYNGDVPDRVTHAQFIKPGESAFLQCPTLEFRATCVGVAGVNGSYTIVRFE